MDTIGSGNTNDAMQPLFQLGTRVEEQCHASPEWKQIALGTVLCPECKVVRPEWHHRPVDVAVRPAPRKAAFVHLWWKGLKVFRRDVIKVLERYMEDFVIGTCTDENSGALVEDYVTCTTRNRIVLVGNEYSQYNECGACDAKWLKTARQPALYLKVEDIPVLGRHVYQDWRGSLLVDSVVREALVSRPAAGVLFEEIGLIEPK